MPNAMLTRAAVIAACGLTALCGCRPKPEIDRQAAKNLADRPLYTFSEADLDAYLPEVRQAHPGLSDRVVALGRQNIGQPYEIYLLGEFPFETLDPDPIYRLDKSDCLTFCEHMYAMALSSDFWGFLETLQRLRYRGGEVGLVTRNHYTLADWNRNNAYLFEDLTEQVGGGKASVPLTQVCRRSRFFGRFGVGQDIPDEPITDAYIPAANVPDVLGDLRNGDFINIIRGDEHSQWAGHTGLIALGVDGTPNFLHSARPTVREQPLIEYVTASERTLGIKVLRLRTDAESIMQQTLANSPDATEISPESVADAMLRGQMEASPIAPSLALDWPAALRFQRYRLGNDTPVDADLQAALTRIDAGIAADLGIPDGERAAGVLDLTDLRLAVVNPDAMFYAASVPKIAILFGYFDKHPEAAFELDPTVRAELGRMIKISSNELAAKYGQLVGIEAIQKSLQSTRYALYDTKKHTGLWHGKNYGIAEPRFGDPVHDFSHGATVRQCLRFYLMMEQGRLVSGPASARMKEIFAAPELEHLDGKFVAGLQGRDVSVLRKSGTWKDWRLDTARIEHNGRTYLLAGISHHPAGDTYLARLAAAVDEELCGPADRKPFVHSRRTYKARKRTALSYWAARQHYETPHSELFACPSAERDDAGAHAVREWPVLDTNELFNEVLISWNIDAPPHVAYCIEARVGRQRDDSWSPYLYFGDGHTAEPLGGRIIECPQGKIDTDVFVSEERFDRMQFRIRALAQPLPDGTIPTGSYLRAARMDVTLSDTTGRVTSVPRRLSESVEDARWQKQIPVPFRSQRVERKEIAGRICSPTSVSMVLDYRGVARPTEEVAERAFDVPWDIYGNWPRAVQTAYDYGVPGYLARFSSWTDVENQIAADQPLILSIKAAPGELTGAPYKSTNGHLLVATGFDADGNVLVNDPAAPTEAEGRRAYARSELETVWMRTKAGTAYVLRPRDEADAPLWQPNARSCFVEVPQVDPRIVVDLRYATPNNFVGKVLYPEGARCLLRCDVAERLSRVQQRLAALGLGLKVYDGFRPLSVQKQMWEIMPDPKYVADPAKGSRHNRGAAVDVTLVDAAGNELEMPTAFDDFTEAAHRDYAGGTEASRENRRILEEAMTAEGFTGLASEWWHFDAPDWESYKIADAPITPPA